jgi:hypothetical protein
MPCRTVNFFLAALFLLPSLAAAQVDTDKYPMSLNVLSAKREANGNVSVQHAQRPAYCNNPKPGFQTGFCATYNPPDIVSQGSTLFVTATLGTKTYTLACARCGMLETGTYPARRSGADFIIYLVTMDKHGKVSKKGTEWKLRIIGEEEQ